MNVSDSVVKKKISVHKTNVNRTAIVVDKTRGEMVTFGKLVESFGIVYDRDKAIKIATKYAIKCIMLEGVQRSGWTEDDKELTGELLFYRVRKEHMSMMTESWGKYIEHTTSAPLALQANSTAPTAPLCNL